MYYEVDKNKEQEYKTEETEMKKLIYSSQYELTAIDLIRAIKKTGEFALNNFTSLESFDKISISCDEIDEETFEKFKSYIGSSNVLLKLAINLLMTYELNTESQESLKRNLRKNKLMKLDELNDLSQFQSSHNNLMNQFFKNDNFIQQSLTWQIRVRIIEIKNLIGSNQQNVYCLVQIGEHCFKTVSRHIDKLQFNNGDDNQVIL
jgi:hypothetical protein